MLSVSVDVLAAGIVPFFFVAFGVMWLGCVISDLFKKKK
jgi:hypothetical protein